MYSRRQQICNFQLLLITINNCALIHNLSSSIPLSLHDKMQTDQNVSNKNAKSLNIPFLPTRRNHTNMFLITDPLPSDAVLQWKSLTSNKQTLTLVMTAHDSLLQRPTVQLQSSNPHWNQLHNVRKKEKTNFPRANNHTHSLWDGISLWALSNQYGQEIQFSLFAETTLRQRLFSLRCLTSSYIKTAKILDPYSANSGI